MSKKLKKLIIFAVVFVVLGFGTIFVFSATSDITTVTIMDFKIFNASGGVIEDQQVYLGKKEDNNFKINVQMSANGSHDGYYVYSTNKDVANVVSRNGALYVEYYAAGDATIVAQSRNLSTVSDKFNISVIENVAADINFEHDENNTKAISIYADNIERRYPFTLTGFDESQDASLISNTIRVVDNYDKTLFKKLEIDHNTNELVVEVNAVQSDKLEIIDTQSTYINLQSCTKDYKGNLKPVKNFIIKTDIVGNIIEDLQLIVSSTPDFTNDVSIYSRKKDSALLGEGEKLIEKIWLTNNINVLYLKARLYFTNNTTLDITNKVITNLIAGSCSIDKINNNSIIAIRANTSNTSKIIVNFNLSAGDSPTFIKSEETFEIVRKASDNDLLITDLYAVENNIYTYKYFDPRFERRDVILDEEGNIIGFSDQDSGIVEIVPDEEPAV